MLVRLTTLTSFGDDICESIVDPDHGILIVTETLWLTVDMARPKKIIWLSKFFVNPKYKSVP